MHSLTPPSAIRLDTLALREFRNVASADLEFPADGVVIVGDNGQGKTNLLEAIAYLGALRSIRNARDRDLVRHGAVAMHVRGSIDESGVPRTIGVGIERTTGRKRIMLDGVEVKRQVDALGVLPSVAWSPTDVALVSGGPAERRRYFDVMLGLTSRSYIGALRRYRAALERRNASIREVARRGRGEDAIHVWEPALAEHGAALITARRDWVDTHAPEFARLVTAIGERAPMSIAHDSDVGDASDVAGELARLLERGRQRDVMTGTTGAGPHRDDLRVQLDGRDARTFASAGQQRTAAIALRLLEARTLRSAGRGHPVLLLDDPFAELDTTRAARALALLTEEDVGQVILAVPREDEIPSTFEALARWRITAGEVAT
jgi:DNA replication and repair protein RecF